MEALVGAFNQEKALVGAFSVIVKTDCETDGSYAALVLGEDELPGVDVTGGHQQPPHPGPVLGHHGPRLLVVGRQVAVPALLPAVPHLHTGICWFG